MYPCDVDGCSYSSTEKKRTQKHKENVHITSTQHKCIHCFNTFFSDPIKLTLHLNDVHTKQETSYSCPIEGCTKQYSRMSNLTRHCKHSHSEIPLDLLQQKLEPLRHPHRTTQHKCTVLNCNKTFFHAHTLRMHQQNIHNKDGSHECPVKGCHLTFPSMIELNKHKQAHAKNQSSETAYLTIIHEKNPQLQRPLPKRARHKAPFEIEILNNPQLLYMHTPPSFNRINPSSKKPLIGHTYKVTTQDFESTIVQKLNKALKDARYTPNITYSDIAYKTYYHLIQDPSVNKKKTLAIIILYLNNTSKLEHRQETFITHLYNRHIEHMKQGSYTAQQNTSNSDLSSLLESLKDNSSINLIESAEEQTLQTLITLIAS